MKFEYNGNLLEEERINLVANEIIEKYPQVSMEKAKEAAMMEGRISDKKTIQDELLRLYNIMLVSSDNKDFVSFIYKDYLSILKEDCFSDENQIYMNLGDAIYNYIIGDNEFPFLSDFL